MDEKMDGKEKKPKKLAKPDKKKVDAQAVIKSLKAYFKEVRSELKKVVWPTPKQLLNNTVIVLVMLSMVGLFIWGVDLVFGQSTRSLASLIKNEPVTDYYDDGVDVDIYDDDQQEIDEQPSDDATTDEQPSDDVDSSDGEGQESSEDAETGDEE